VEIVMGAAFTFVPTMQTLGAEFGINAVLGAVPLSSLAEIVMGLFRRKTASNRSLRLR
jgi:xanthine/uracil permease